MKVTYKHIRCHDTKSDRKDVITHPRQRNRLIPESSRADLTNDRVCQWPDSQVIREEPNHHESYEEHKRATLI